MKKSFGIEKGNTRLRLGCADQAIRRERASLGMAQASLSRCYIALLSLQGEILKLMKGGS